MCYVSLHLFFVKTDLTVNTPLLQNPVFSCSNVFVCLMPEIQLLGFEGSKSSQRRNYLAKRSALLHKHTLATISCHLLHQLDNWKM